MSARIDGLGSPAMSANPGDRTSTRNKPLIAHIVFSLDVGGLENGLVNLINHMPEGYRHVVICLSHFTDFRRRIERPEVKVFALHKRPGKDFGVYVRLWRLLRRLKPDIVHTRNYGALDCAAIAALSRIRCRVHGEHGWDVTDLYGESAKYKLLRRGLRPLIQRHVTVSRDLAAWLTDSIGIPGKQVRAICNGVDTNVFRPAAGDDKTLIEAGTEFGPDKFVIGTVGRMDAVKDQVTLIEAVARLVAERPDLKDRVRLAIIGDGPLNGKLQSALKREHLLSISWMPGSRDDIRALLPCMDLFVLPSLNEGISNTLLEAMACGLPVVATSVGGNPELVIEGETGTLTPPRDASALARSMETFVDNPQRARDFGRAGRKRAEETFSLDAMVAEYTRLYDSVLGTVA